MWFVIKLWNVIENCSSPYWSADTIIRSGGWWRVFNDTNVVKSFITRLPGNNWKRKYCSVNKSIQLLLRLWREMNVSSCGEKGKLIKSKQFDFIIKCSSLQMATGQVGQNGIFLTSLPKSRSPALKFVVSVEPHSRSLFCAGCVILRVLFCTLTFVILWVIYKSKLLLRCARCAGIYDFVWWACERCDWLFVLMARLRHSTQFAPLVTIRHGHSSRGQGVLWITCLRVQWRCSG